MNFLICARSLIGKLVAWEIQDLKALISEFSVHGFQRIIMWGESTACSGVDDQKDLAFIVS